MEPKVTIGAPFALTDHMGLPVTDRSYPGKYLLVFFGFTHCRRVCPERLGVISTALAEIGSLSQKVQPLYITVDPDRDDPGRMKLFLEAGYPLFVGLTGSASELAEVRRAYKVFAERRDALGLDGGYDVPHTAMTFVMGPDGAYVTHFSDSATPKEIATGLRSLLG